MADEREEGIQAIIYLQKVFDKDEPYERAAKNWDSFMDWEKEQTIKMYRLMRRTSGMSTKSNKTSEAV